MCPLLALFHSSFFIRRRPTLHVSLSFVNSYAIRCLTCGLARTRLHLNRCEFFSALSFLLVMFFHLLQFLTVFHSFIRFENGFFPSLLPLQTKMSFILMENDKLKQSTFTASSLPLDLKSKCRLHPSTHTLTQHKHLFLIDEPFFLELNAQFLLKLRVVLFAQ